MWIFNSILSLAPDTISLEKAKPLATTRKWRNLGGTEKVVWGECKSGGATYYKTLLKPEGPVFNCNCPSRKYPCKHSLALLMIFVQNSDAFKISEDLPDWVFESLENLPQQGKELNTSGRTEAQEQQLAEQRIKNREKRLFQMEAGFNELEIWLSDIIRQGLAVLEGQSDVFFKEISERMVNAKLGSLARRIRNLETLIGQTDWHEKLLTEIGEIYLLIKGFKNLHKLPPQLQQELLNVAGINFKKEDLLSLSGIKDTWFIIGQTEGNDDANLFYRRTWIVGEKTQRMGLILDFAWGSNPYEHNWKTGTQFLGEIIYYPSAYPLRVLIKNFESTTAPIHITGFENFDALLQKYAAAIGQNPWLNLFPAFLENVIPTYHNKQFLIIDSHQKQLEVLAKDDLGWKMLALSGGKPINIFGQWEGNFFEPFSAVIDSDFFLLQDIKPLPRPNRWNNSFF